MDSIYFGLSPLPVRVTTRIVTFLVGNPYKPSFPLLLGGGTTQDIFNLHFLWEILRVQGILFTQASASPAMVNSMKHVEIPTMWRFRKPKWNLNIMVSNWFISSSRGYFSASMSVGDGCLCKCKATLEDDPL